MNRTEAIIALLVPMVAISNMNNVKSRIIRALKAKIGYSKSH